MGPRLPRFRFRPHHIDDPKRVPWLRDSAHNANARDLSGNACPLGQYGSLARDRLFVDYPSERFRDRHRAVPWDRFYAEAANGVGKLGVLTQIIRQTL